MRAVTPYIMPVLSLFAFSVSATETDLWRIAINPELQAEEAVRLAIADIKETGRQFGMTFEIVSDDDAPDSGNRILVGGAARNAETQRLIKSGALDIEPVAHADGYAIQTVGEPGNRTMAVAGGSLMGDVYGLYWVWDRMRVHWGLPEINTVREPAMDVRFSAAWYRSGFAGRSKETMHRALRYSINWVSGPNVLDLVPWNSEPEATRNAETREETRELIEYARSLGMKYYAFSNEFTYHPSLLEDLDAELSPCDSRFWDAVQGKYRKLFEAMPELDGVKLCNDDISGFWDDYRPFDLTREDRDCELSYTQRFNTFVSKMHDVIVNEFDKEYFHFTWGLREHEVHVQPEVFQQIFNDEIPTDNLYLMPKVTRADRWWYQAYNRTFNLTPHEQVVLFEPMNYYEGGSANIFPTFSGEYFQGGLQTFLTPEDHNIRGAALLAGQPPEGWGTVQAYIYALYRLMWDPYDCMETIARDFAAIHFGPEVAEAMGRVYMLTPAAYKYGLHIEPISYGQFNSFLHMRVGTFPADGYPAIDGGKEHLDFLRWIYLRVSPWRDQVLAIHEQGFDAAEEMQSIFADAKPLFDDAELAAEIGNRLDMTRRLIRTNIGYVETTLAYFDYFDDASEPNREALTEAYERFAEAREAFANTPGFGYRLFGVDVLLDNAEAALDDVDAHRAVLERTPDRDALEALIGRQQDRYREILEERADEAVKFAEFEVFVDGQDLLRVQGDGYTIEHLRWDPAQVRKAEFLEALPEERVTVIPKDIESRPIHPFMLEQPSAANDFTAEVYLDDQPPGHGWFIFDLYYIPEPPEALGLDLPWSGDTP